jgi:hypothetical protein
MPSIGDLTGDALAKPVNKYLRPLHRPLMPRNFQIQYSYLYSSGKYRIYLTRLRNGVKDELLNPKFVTKRFTNLRRRNRGHLLNLSLIRRQKPEPMAIHFNSTEHTLRLREHRS